MEGTLAFICLNDDIITQNKDAINFAYTLPIKLVHYEETISLKNLVLVASETILIDLKLKFFEIIFVIIKAMVNI